MFSAWRRASSRIIALDELAEFHFGEVAGGLRRDRAKPAELDAARPPVGVSVLEDERLQTRVNGANAETLQFPVPEKRLAGLVARGPQAFDSRLGQPPAHGSSSSCVELFTLSDAEKSVSAM